MQKYPVERPKCEGYFDTRRACETNNRRHATNQHESSLLLNYYLQQRICFLYAVQKLLIVAYSLLNLVG